MIGDRDVRGRAAERARHGAVGVHAAAGDRLAGELGLGVDRAHDRVLDVQRGQAGARREHERGDAGRVRARHRGALQVLVRGREVGREDRGARREDVDVVGAVVGEGRLAVVLVGRADAQHVRRRQRARAVRRPVDVGVVVAGRDHVQRVRVRLDGRELRLVQARAAEAGVDDPDAHLAGVVERLGDADAGAAPVGAEGAQRHELGAVRDTRDALVVVGLGRDGAGDVRAVPVVVLRQVVRAGRAVALGDAELRVLAHEVPALPVVDVAVAVVVDAVAALVAI